MKPCWEPVAGGVTAARGFRAAAVRCGIRQAEGDDLGLLACDVQGTAAAAFTTNRVAAAPVLWSRQAVARGKVRAAVVNAGCANACTGERGLRDVGATAAKAAEVLGLAPDNFLIASTGIIGHYLPVEKLLAGLPRAAQQLDASLAAGERFARAIMTTDTRLKQLALRCNLGGGAHVTLGGATKGAGMIAPGMATTLTFLTTDAAIEGPLLSKLLRRAVERTYNRISIDEHMSTNDTVLCLASGLADAPPIAAGSGAARRFGAALEELCRGLALKIVADGEGATRLVRIEVVGAPSVRAAVAAGRAIADSPLCKCALHSGDPNWGRFVSAAGYACRAFDEARARLYLGERLAYAAGAPADATKAELAAAMAGTEVTLRLEMGLGKAAATVWTCDLSKEYIAINADYHT
ncbi:MAG: bifunctional glutamate N-acetyltransferase/amino-acid acetyltransferase ArgJ [Planctomycetes bacterium]|nr:bifunctional glutamate N-acetyltransferase/amino-acid acetyltransferase ArgJ [Planctomycetota bacterium]